MSLHARLRRLEQRSPLFHRDDLREWLDFVDEWTPSAWKAAEGDTAALRRLNRLLRAKPDSEIAKRFFDTVERIYGQEA